MKKILVTITLFSVFGSFAAVDALAIILNPASTRTGMDFLVGNGQPFRNGCCKCDNLNLITGEWEAMTPFQVADVIMRPVRTDPDFFPPEVPSSAACDSWGEGKTRRCRVELGSCPPPNPAS